MAADLRIINEYLDKINLVVERKMQIWAEQHKRGEDFNIFKVCGVNHYEVIHSAIIAEFLDPAGSHGQDHLFLKAFLDTIPSDNFLFDLNGVSVKTEDNFDNGRIDIIIQNANKQSIIIENKIYAKDQNEQLKRYDRFASDVFVNGYKILYLTLDGHEPEDQASKEVRHTSVSYSKHILKWLNECKRLVADKPRIRETISQYIYHIKALTSTQNMENNQEILEILLKYPKATVEILNMHSELEQYLLKSYVFPALDNVAKEFNLEFVYNEQDFLYKSKIGFFMKSSNDIKWRIQFEFDQTNWHQLAVGLVWNTPPYKRIKRLFDAGPNDLWFYGWKYLDTYQNWDLNTLFSIRENPKSFEDKIRGTLNELLNALFEEGFDMENISKCFKL